MTKSMAARDKSGSTRYVSTRGQTPSMGFSDAVLTGLAPDGGLLVPSAIPTVSARQCEDWQGLGFVDLAKRTLPFFIDDISRSTIDTLVNRAYETFEHPDIVAIEPMGDLHVLELFHGPTLAFKDVALQLLGQLFAHILTERRQTLRIVAATSGDTGSAAIEAVRGLPNIEIFVMYPKGRVSALQERQMTTVPDGNVHCLAVEGSFDDCQQLMKGVFSDRAFKEAYALGAVNSVNWARILAQLLYYIYVSLNLGNRRPVSFAVPTGNFGNVFAGYYAKRMGLPIDKMILASNANNVLPIVFETARYRRGAVRQTNAPAMDIQVASNFERYLYYLHGANSEPVCRFMGEFERTDEVTIDAAVEAGDFVATAISNEEAEEAIQQCDLQFGYLPDPHTAMGIAAAAKYRRGHLCCKPERQSARSPLVCVATAHPAKFPDIVEPTVGRTVRHPRLDRIKKLPSHYTTIAADLNALKRTIKDSVAPIARKISK